MKFTILEELYLKENYANLGCKFCANYLNRPYSNVKAKALRMGLRVTQESINKSRQNPRNTYNLSVNPHNFINVSTPYHAYLLGFIWGDGYIYKQQNFITIHICESDANKLQETIFNTGKWCVIKNITKNSNYQNDITFKTSNLMLYNFLLSLNYKDKSRISHQKVLEYIPKHMQYMWLRGLIDADGSFYQSGSSRCCSIASTYEQDWDYLIEYLHNLNIEVYIRKRIQKLGKSSELYFYKQQYLQNLGNFIYPNGWDNIGLKRKFDKYQEIIHSYKKILRTGDFQ